MEFLNFRVRHPARGGWLAAGLLLAVGGMLFAGEARREIFAARAAAELHRAHMQFQSDTNDATAAWQFARACFYFNEFVTNNAGSAELASQGIAASRQSLARESNSAPAHYYLAIELGLLADTKRNLAAFKLVREMEREFKTADDLDEHFDYAGPARCLGLLYRDAPGWPLSVGSRRKARDWLEQAARLAPDYLENQLTLAESYWQWKDREAAVEALQKFDALWPAVQTNLAGAAWERSWDDWADRRDTLREKMNGNSPAKKPPKNPRN